MVDMLRPKHGEDNRQRFGPSNTNGADNHAGLSTACRSDADREANCQV